MYLPPRQLAFRLALWTGLFLYVVWRLNRPELPTVRELPVPPAQVGSLAPPIVDPEALAVAMEAVRSAGCDARATLAVRVGPAGLERAELAGAVTDEVAGCVTRAVEAAPWPRGAQQIEMSIEL